MQYLARDLPEPSPLSHEILNAKPYSFLDDAPLEERRTQAVYTRRAFEPSSADDLGALDPSAIERVRDEAWPEVRDADELHDALLTSGFLTEVEGISGRDAASWSGFWRELVDARRASRVELGHGQALWVAAERLPEVKAVIEGSSEREAAIRELLRGRLGIVGPTTAATLGASLNLPEADADIALAALEGEGVVLRGHFTPTVNGSAPALEWCDRRLLARIHRYTLSRLRAEIEPVSAADFMRFLFAWQRVDPEYRAAGLEGLAAVDRTARWLRASRRCMGERGARRALPGIRSGAARHPVHDGPSSMGTAVGWTGGRADSSRADPVDPDFALSARTCGRVAAPRESRRTFSLSSYARIVKETLERRGASFFHELVSPYRDSCPPRWNRHWVNWPAWDSSPAIASPASERLIMPSSKRKPLSGARRRHKTAPYGIETAGRWSLLGGQADGRTAGRTIELFARTLLRRYGVVFKRLHAQETGASALARAV